MLRRQRKKEWDNSVGALLSERRHRFGFSWSRVSAASHKGKVNRLCH